MSTFRHLDRLERLHRFIKFRRTGPPEAFAQRMELSRSMLYVLLADLKKLGAPIDYCPHRESYYYTRPVELQFGYVTTDSATSIDPPRTTTAATVRSLQDRPTGISA